MLPVANRRRNYSLQLRKLVVLLQHIQDEYNMVTSLKTAALFDCDGVIVNTEPQYTAFWTTIGHEFLPSRANFAKEIKGNTLINIFNCYFPGDEALQAEIKVRLKHFEAHMQFPYVEGVVAFIRALQQQGIPTACVTSSNEEKMASLYAALPDFQSLFTHIFTAEDTRRSKPAPDCYIAAANYFGLAPQACVVFEDSLSGLQAGRDSGAKVVGLSTENAPERIAPLCDVVIPDFNQFTYSSFSALLG